MSDFLPTTEGKQKNLSATIDLINDLENLSVCIEDELELECFSDLVILEAQEIARTDADFYVDHFRPFLRAWKRCVNKFKKEKRLQLVRLSPDDYLFISGKNVKLPSSYVNKYN